MDVFAANDIAAFYPGNATVTEDTAFTASWDAQFTNKALRAFGGDLTTGKWINPSTGATVTLTDGWLHCDLMNNSSGAGGSELVGWLDAANQQGLRIRNVSVASWIVEYWTGAAWAALTPQWSHGNSGTRATYDIHWVITDTTYTVQIVYNNLLVAEGTSPPVTTIGKNVAKVRFSGGGFSAGLYVSQVLVADANTVGAKVANLALTGNGANTAWTGIWSDVWKISNGADALLIGSTAAAQDETYVAADITLPTNMKVASVWIAARVRAEAGASVKPLLRIGATNYEGAYAFPNVVAGFYTPTIAAFLLDPSTSGAWSIANVNAAEIGVRSA